MAARNITLTLPDELIRKAKIVAAERETSISAIVTSLLRQVVGDAEEYDTMWANEEQAMRTGLLEVGPIDWTRDELHRR